MLMADSNFSGTRNFSVGKTIKVADFIPILCKMKKLNNLFQAIHWPVYAGASSLQRFQHTDFCLDGIVARKQTCSRPF